MFAFELKFPSCPRAKLKCPVLTLLVRFKESFSVVQTSLLEGYIEKADDDHHDGGYHTHTPRDMNESWRITRIGPKGGLQKGGVQDPQLRWKRGKIRCDAGNNDMSRRREKRTTTAT